MNKTVWLNIGQIAQLFNKGRTTISEHISNIFKEGELDEKVVCRNFRHTTQHGAVEGKYQVKTLTPVEEAYLESINALGILAKRNGKTKR